MRIALYGNEYQQEHIADITKLFAVLARYNTWIIIEKSFYDYLCCVMPTHPQVNEIIGEKDDFTATIALSIGGDGTFLHTAQWVSHKGIPILGINTGHLGYLADVSVSDIDDVIEELMTERYKIECRTVLEVVTMADVEIEHPYALNEVAILKQDTSSMIAMRTLVNGIDLTTYMGDGLIISTPTGSTAYNISVGGPILEPTSCSWAVSPIAAHSLTMRPLVLRDDSVIEVITNSRVASYRLSLDGRSIAMPEGSSVTLRKAPFAVKVIQRLNHNFAETLRNKLMWGLDKR
ncbi:MAG: NAD kinase [Muribaculaceae bacterium]